MTVELLNRNPTPQNFRLTVVRLAQTHVRNTKLNPLFAVSVTKCDDRLTWEKLKPALSSSIRERGLCDLFYMVDGNTLKTQRHRL